MGAAKSIPVVGEGVTVVESGSKLLAAGGCRLVGKKEAAGRPLNGAGEAWIDYSERSPVPASVRIIAAAIDDDDEEIKRIDDKFCGSVSDAADGIPVVGHIKGVVHYAMDDDEKGANSLKAATRSTAVAAICTLTGGLAAAGGFGVGVAAAAGATEGVGTGFLYDVGISIAEEKPYGTMAAWDNFAETKDPNDCVDAVLGHVGDGAAGAIQAAAAHEAVNAYQRAQRSQANRNALSRRIGEEMTDQAMDLARDMEPIQKIVGPEENVVASRVYDPETGQYYDGVNRHTRNLLRENGTSNPRAQALSREIPQKKTGLRLADSRNVMENGQTGSHILRDGIGENNMPRRPPSSCAEQQAYQGWYDKVGSRADVTNTRMVSIKLTSDGIETIQRCNNCLTYKLGMGECRTDIPWGPQPVQPSNTYRATLASNNHWRVATAAGVALASRNAGVGSEHELCDDHDKLISLINFIDNLD